jgi:diketogulonate reductase-like aldo/keto reductase
LESINYHLKSLNGPSRQLFKQATDISTLPIGICEYPPSTLKTQLSFPSNEAQVGSTIQSLSSQYPRSQVYLTTKLGLADKITERLNESVSKMDPRGDEGYVDLFLIHSPSAGPEKRREQWGELERLVNEGKAKSIGVSN